MNEGNVTDQLLRRLGRLDQPAEPAIDPAAEAPDIQVVTHETEIALLKHRADEADRRAERVEAKIDRLGDVLTDIRVELAKRPTTAGLWGMVATVIAVSLTMIAIVVAILAIPGISTKLFGG